MSDCRDNQDVGLEAAIIKRKRNSSLVERLCGEICTGLKLGAEDVDRASDGSGALCKSVKVCCEACWRYHK